MIPEPGCIRQNSRRNFLTITTPDSPKSAPEVRENSKLKNEAVCEQAVRSEGLCKDSWSMSGDNINRHHADLRIALYARDEKTFPVPLKYIDVTKQTKIDIESVSESTINDIWTEDKNVSLSEEWTSTTWFETLRARLPEGYNWFEEDPQNSRSRPLQTTFGQKLGPGCPRSKRKNCRLI